MEHLKQFLLNANAMEMIGVVLIVLVFFIGLLEIVGLIYSCTQPKYRSRTSNRGMSESIRGKKDPNA